MRLQLAFPNADIVPPQVFNRLLDHARHGDGVPGRHADPDRLLQLPRAADDRRARPGVPASQRLRLLAVALRRACCSTSATSAAEGLYGAGSAPDVGWFAYAPLTERPFSRGNSTDYWILSILLTSIGIIATAINVIDDGVLHALQGHDAAARCRCSSGWLVVSPC